MNWPYVDISKVCLKTSIRDPRKTRDASFLYVDISSVNRNSKTIANTPEILGEEAPSRARKEISSGDIIVSTVRPNLNAVALVPSKLDGQIASTGFCVLRPNMKFLISRYLFYFVQTKYFVESLTSKVRGAHYPAVSDRNVKGVKISLPSLSEQQRIVEILDQVDAIRKKQAQANETTENILPTLFYKMFGDTATNPNDFEKKKLGNIIKVKSGNFLPAKNMDPEGIYPVYGGNGINGYHSVFMFEEPVIVIGRVGIYCGAVHYSQPQSWITDNALFVSEKLIDIHDSYLEEALRLANLNQYAVRAGQPLISGKRIYPIEILIPPKVKQRKFDRMKKQLCTTLDGQKLLVIKIDLLFNTILHRAFSGDLTAKWREAHMKELLAEMEHQLKALNVGGR